MKINESKETLPVSFITDFISRGWTEIGLIKDQIAGMKDTFSGTSEVTEILQGLLDAYLVSVGQFELFLEKKKHVVIDNEPVKKEIKEELQPKEADGIEDADIKEGFVDIDNINIKVESKVCPMKPCAAVECDIPNCEKPECEECEEPTIECKGPDCAVEKPEVKTGHPVEEFEYFMDFDEPEGEAPTDDDIYVTK